MTKDYIEGLRSRARADIRDVERARKAVQDAIYYLENGIRVQEQHAAELFNAERDWKVQQMREEAKKC